MTPNPSDQSVSASHFGLRQRHARVHRVLGRCYVIGVVMAATISLSITMSMMTVVGY